MTEIILAVVAAAASPLSAWLSARLMRTKYMAELEKMRTEVKQMQSDVRSRELDNDRKAIQMTMELVVEPLRKEMKSLQSKVDNLTNAIEQIHKCPYADDCPVARELQHNEADAAREREGDAAERTLHTP